MEKEAETTNSREFHDKKGVKLAMTRKSEIHKKDINRDLIIQVRKKTQLCYVKSKDSSCFWF